MAWCLFPSMLLRPPAHSWARLYGCKDKHNFRNNKYFSGKITIWGKKSDFSSKKQPHKYLQRYKLLFKPQIVLSINHTIEKDAPWHLKRYSKPSENRLHSAIMEPVSRVQWSLFSDEIEPVFRCCGASFQSVWHIVLTRAGAYILLYI